MKHTWRIKKTTVGRLRYDQEFEESFVKHNLNNSAYPKYWTTVADPGSEFFIPDPGSKKIRNPDPQRRIYVFLTRNNVSKLSEIYSGMFIPDPYPGIKKTPDPQHCI
jgi:hypothetical protein